MIAIINYGLGNLSSINNMCRRIGVEAKITAQPDEICRANKLILPGVGHFKKGMDNLYSSGLKDLLDDLVLKQKVPVLGICLGAQLMTEHSEEGNVRGLGWVAAETVRFNAAWLNGLKVPHMGWSELKKSAESRLWENLPENARFYFVHTYHFRFTDLAYVTGMALYGYDFACAFQRDNICGVQFHPEKSHKFGMRLLESYSNL